MNTSIRRLYWALAAGFAALALMLGYWQVVAAPALDDRADNPQAIQRERQIDRGRILACHTLEGLRQLTGRHYLEDIFVSLVRGGADP